MTNKLILFCILFAFHLQLTAQSKSSVEYYNPLPLPADFLFNVDGVELGKPIMSKY